MDLVCTRNINDNFHVENGRMSYCRIASSWHWFILVESGTYNCGQFVSDNQISVAFSYLPAKSYEYVTEKYKEQKKQEHNFIASKEDSNLSTLAGYNPLLFTKSYVVDTWKLTNKYVVMKSKPVHNWRYCRFQDKFSLYNVLSIIPYWEITDCIGYSDYQYSEAK